MGRFEILLLKAKTTGFAESFEEKEGISNDAWASS